MSESFDATWLALREPADAFARDPALAERLVSLLPKRPHLVDLGAGTGSLFRWLAPRIGGAQAWTLVDSDAALVEEAFDTIARRADSIGLTVSAPNKRTLLVHAPEGAWRVEGLIADLADAPDWLPKRGADAVVCSALLDLVSEDWLEDLADVVECPFYASMTVDGRDRFLPPHPLDGVVAQAFRRDQRRDKGFDGPALGGGAPAAAARAFAARGFSVEQAGSAWELGPRRHRELLLELVLGHADAASAHLRQPRRIEAWTEARSRQWRQNRLRAVIGHRDLLALPAAG
ncbi:hypothetical protein RGI145_06200 [Roseomonas gilardii]|uniref:Class I SAM-dependent methyltransferase n=1 Tax=Roseomonas gilardii TaxID=257708 RepID=A0A1L7AD81_9PROT|nr:class I SAM-dependent methyltransferase [Roseomonas gilardii]APT56757.1 hypothetical protein RGI145_06200 [Roseomonas gilardii]